MLFKSRTIRKARVNVPAPLFTKVSGQAHKSLSTFIFSSANIINTNIYLRVTVKIKGDNRYKAFITVFDHNKSSPSLVSFS